ncbi:hypothetical protein M0R45_011218 [Rubus argutus]|uniref:VWFA domain-containing protein n=1 Tax=Rubus argutus TaxID=59490 RepID=A0AAW1YBU2_RUBAR
MVLEATMICVDNSEWMRNGDHSPSRFQAQSGKYGWGIDNGGQGAAIQVAQLALKHRQNKNQQQRILVFAGSPVKNDNKALEIIGKKLKKSSVALDIVDFGEQDDGKPEKLEALVSLVNNNGTSHIVHVPPCSDALSDVLISTPLFIGDEGEGAGFAVAAGIGGHDYGVDPNIDPELALALRMSMEEERARQEVAAAGKGEQLSSKSEESDDVDENALLLMQALAMSMNNSDPAEVGDAEMSEATGVDQDLALALQMSMQESAGGASESADASKVLEDQSLLSSILESLPGIDPNDPSFKEFLASLYQEKNEQDPSNDDK